MQNSKAVALELGDHFFHFVIDLPNRAKMILQIS